MPSLQVGENSLFYAKSPGDGRATILIHGAGGSHLHWPASLRRLPGPAVYAIDLPGHGRSEGGGRQRVEDYAAVVLGFMDAVGLQHSILIGHSMGGAIAQTVALCAPQRVVGLVLVGTGARLRVAPAILSGLEQDFDQTVQLLSEWTWGPGAEARLVAEGRRQMLEVGSAVLLGDFLACDRFDVREQAGRIAAPTLAITGSEDRMTPPRFGEWLADHIPGARFVLVEGAGHMVALERPEEVAAAVQHWLGEL
jgi:pimeloyl-ACP methyl ester carboxylesterase